MADAWAAPLGLDAASRDIAAQLLERLAVGGVSARRTRDKVSRAFARGLASMVNVFDPGVVLLGAGLWQDLWPAVRGDVEPWLDRLVIPVLRPGLRVRPAGLGVDSTVVGAAELAFAPLLADPLGMATGAGSAVVGPPAGPG
jgi:predicted NBD/HSP70 family sugar kinase